MKTKKIIPAVFMTALLSVGGAQVLPQEKIASVDKTRGANRLTAEGEADEILNSRLRKEVRHELVMLPYYNLFDWLEYEIQDDATVILRGQVVRPTTRSDAANRIKEIEGVTKVENQIEVLPLSPADDRLRIALYRSIFGYGSPLFRYGTRVVPSIHIIVKNGRATLKGVVANQGDSNLAYVKANSVAGLFEVKNELTVEKKRTAY